MKEKIFIVEDEFSINDILTYALQAEGYEVKSAFNGKEARELLKEFTPDLMLLDVNLPDDSGFELCKEFSASLEVPIIFITARNDVIDRILGLELGADDYITKPFHIKEVLARVKVALRRVDKYSEANKKSRDTLQLTENLMINLKERHVILNSEDVKLKPKEYDLLEFLLQNKNRVFSREEILDRVWGYEYEGDYRTIDIHIRRLRAKLGLEGGQTFIETVFGVGYVLRCNNEK